MLFSRPVEALQIPAGHNGLQLTNEHFLDSQTEIQLCMKYFLS